MDSPPPDLPDDLDALRAVAAAALAQNADDAPEAAGSVMVAAIQASILLGAVVGGLLLDAMSIQATFIGGVALAAAAIGVGGVLSATSTTPASDVVPDPKHVITLGSFRVTL